MLISSFPETRSPFWKLLWAVDEGKLETLSGNLGVQTRVCGEQGLLWICRLLQSLTLRAHSLEGDRGVFIYGD